MWEKERNSDRLVWQKPVCGVMSACACGRGERKGGEGKRRGIRCERGRGGGREKGRMRGKRGRAGGRETSRIRRKRGREEG